MSTTFANSINSNPIYAERAEKDAAGNTISTTYATKAEVPAAQVQSDWSEADSTDVSYIKNKPQNLVQDASYVHTDNNFTTALKDKLDGIASGAEVNVQANWTEADSSSDSYIQNKPQNLVQDASYVHTDNNFTTSLKDKLDGIASGAEVNVQANWNEADSSSDSYIQNKPQNLVQDASYVHTDNNFTTSLKDKLDGIASGAEVNVQANWTEADSTADSYIQNKPNLAAVATSGSYTDLTNTPTIPTVPVQDVTVDGVSVVSNGTAVITMPSVPVTDVTVNGTSVVSNGTAAVTVPTATSDLQNDSNFITLSDVPAQVQADWTEADNTDPSYIANKPNLAAVATSGSYTDLSNTPTIPAAPVQSNWTEADNTSLAYIQNKPNLAAVATSGAYSDLSGTPTINNVPAVTSNDDNKVLKASYTGGVGSYSWEQESGGTVTDVEVDGTSVVSGGVASITMPTELVPTVTSNDDGKVLKASYSGGSGSYSWETESGGGGTQADWTEDDPTEPSYIENKPVPKTLVAGTGITITESSTELTVASTNQLYSAGNGLTLNNATFAVDTSVIQPKLVAGANIEIDPVTNEISGEGGADWSATSGEPGYIENKPDLVDIVAGPGIHVDNPDGNTLRISLAQPNETVLWSGFAAASDFPLTLSESMANFEKIVFVWIPRYQGDYGSPTVYDTRGTDGYSGTLKYTLMAPYWNAYTTWIGWWFLSPTDNQTKLSSEKNAYGNPYTTTAVADGLACRMVKIIGVNRIANN